MLLSPQHIPSAFRPRYYVDLTTYQQFNFVSKASVQTKSILCRRQVERVLLLQLGLGRPNTYAPHILSLYRVPDAFAGVMEVLRRNCELVTIPHTAGRARVTRKVIFFCFSNRLPEAPCDFKVGNAVVNIPRYGE